VRRGRLHGQPLRPPLLRTLRPHLRLRGCARTSPMLRWPMLLRAADAKRPLTADDKAAKGGKGGKGGKAK